MLTFTMDELKSFTIPKLKKLYTYYYPGESTYRMTKEKLIVAIYSAANVHQKDKDIPQSVRVRRIYESQNNS